MGRSCQPGVCLFVLLAGTLLCCHAEEGAFMLLVDSTSVIQRGINSSLNPRYILKDQEDIADIDLDFHTGYLYWSSQQQQKILRCQIDQDELGAVEDVVAAHFPQALAIDWLTRNLYWSNTDAQDSHAIMYQPLEGSLGTRTFLTSLYQVSHMVIHPAEKTLFWVDKGLLRNAGQSDQFWEFVKIESTSLIDVSQRKVLTEDDLGEPTALTVDYVEEKVYWADGMKNTIERMDFDGENKKTVIARVSIPFTSPGELDRPQGIAVYGTQVYWSEPSKQAIYQSDKDGKDQQVHVNTADGLVYPTTLQIYSMDMLLVGGACPEPWVLLDEHCYLFVNQPEKSRSQAQTYCQDVATESRLVSVNTQAERFLIESYLEDYFPNYQHWWTSGGDKNRTGRWTWDGDRSSIDFAGVWGVSPPTAELYTQYVALSRVLSADGADIDHYDFKLVGAEVPLPLICEQPTFSMDPCSANNGNCQQNCVLDGRRHYCTCRQGYQLHGNGRDCEDMDECTTLQPCDGACQNTYGSYRCSCAEGFTWNEEASVCQDVDECSTEESVCGQECINTEGSYHCECRWGYQLSGDLKSCDEVNECRNNNPCHQVCVDSIGSYSCSCYPGFSLSEDAHTCDRAICIDPPEIEGFVVDCNSTADVVKVGENCKLSCEKGIITGSTVIECGEGGEWTAPTSQCVLGPPNPGETNSPPTRIILSTFSIPESARRDSVVAWLKTEDADGNTQTHTYTLNDNTDTFAIISQPPGIKLIGELDYETKSEYKVNVTVTDSGIPPLSFSDILHFSILDINEAPSSPMLNGTVIAENSPPGTVIGYLQSRDPDFHQSVTFRLLLNDRRVAIDHNAVIVIGDFDYEVISDDPVYPITVVAMDNSSQPLRAVSQIILTVTDVNEPPVDVRVRPRMLPEYIPSAEFTITRNQVIGTFLIQDPDPPNRHHVEILNQGITHPSLENHKCFWADHNDPSAPVLRVADPECFDFELQASFVLLVNVTDIGGLSLVKRLEIFVKDMNDPPTDIIFTPNPLPANLPSGSIAGTLFAVDDSGPHKFELLSHTRLFTIEGNAVKVSEGVLMPGNVTLEIKATDRRELSVVRNITVEISWPDTPPSITVTLGSSYICPTTQSPLEGQLACVSEATALGVSIATVKVSDVTANVSLYTFSHLFEYRGNQLYVRAALDYESLEENAMQLHLRVQDRFEQEVDKFIHIQITDANDAPLGVELSNSLVPYGALSGYEIGRFTCRDEDETDTHTFSLINSAKQMFSVDVDTGVLTVSGSLRVAEYEIEAQCFDAAGLASPLDVGDFTVEVQLQVVSDVLLSLTDDTVSESSTVGTVIGDFILETSRTESFTLLLENQGHLPFSISGTQEFGWSLTLLKPVDYETQAYYHMVVKATTDTMAIFTNFTIKVLDVSEAPQDLKLDTSVVAEGPPGRKFGVVIVMGGEPGVAYTLSTTSAEFTLVALSPITAAINTKKELDYEQHKSHFLVVTATSTEHRNASLTRNFTIFVMNVNEAPTMLSFRKVSVRENSPPPMLATTVEISDPDGQHDDHECSVTDGGLGWFTVGYKLRQIIHIQTTQPVDYEDPRIINNQHQVLLTVQCWDWLGQSISSTTNISISDVNEPPTDIISRGGGVLQIQENMKPGAVVGTLLAVDQDVGDEFRFNLPSMLSGPFVMIGNQLSTLVPLNYEAQPEHDVQVAVSDKAGNRFTKELTIHVIDVNEAPSSINLIQSQPLLENSPAGTSVGNLSTDDMDINQTHSYIIHTQVPNGAFRLLGARELVVWDASLLDHEQWPLMQVTVVSTDSGQPTMQITHTLRIVVEDVNEAPTEITMVAPDGSKRLHVSENAAAGTIIGNITVHDPDTNGQYFFCMLPMDENTDAPFQHADANGWNQHSSENNYVELSVAGVLDYEMKSEYNLTVLCWDNLGLQGASSFIVYIDDSNEAPRGILVTSYSDIQAITNVEPNLEQLLERDWGFQNSVVTRPETPGHEMQDNVLVAFLYVVDEDNLSQQQQHTITVITEDEYMQGVQMTGDERERRRKKRSVPAPGRVSFSVQSGSPWQRLVAKGIFDFESVPAYTVFFKCEDSGSPAQVVYSVVVVRVSDVQEAPTAISLHPASVAENAAPRSIIGELVIADQDRPRFGYTITIQDRTLADTFSVINTTLYLLNPKILNHEVTPAVTVRVKVEEVKSKLTYTQSVTVTIVDANEAPCCLTFTGGTTLGEVALDAGVGKVVGGLMVRDEDEGDKHTFQLVPAKHSAVDNTSLQLLSVRSNHLILAEEIPADFTVSSILVAAVQATDRGGLSTTSLLYVAFTPRSPVQPHPCPEKACAGNAFCDTTTSPPQCVCKTGYTGLSCDVAKSQCENLVCPHNGRCVPGTKSPVCRCSEPFAVNCTGCVPGYSGDNCQICNECKLAASTAGEISTLSYLAWIVGGIIAMSVLIIIILLLVFIVRRQKKQRPPVEPRRVGYDSVDGRISISAISEPGQYENPLYESIGGLRRGGGGGATGSTQVCNEMYDSTTADTKLAAHLDALNYQRGHPRGGPTNDLDSGVVEDSSDPGDTEEGRAAEANRDLGVITVPHDTLASPEGRRSSSASKDDKNTNNNHNFTDC